MNKIINNSYIKLIVEILISLFAIVMLGSYTISNHLVDYNADQSLSHYRILIQFAAILSIIVIAIIISFSLGKKFFIRLGLSYAIYLLVSYILLFTQNLNNPSFYVLGLLSNRFFELGSGWLILSIVVLSYLFKTLLTKVRFFRIILDKYDINTLNIRISYLMPLIVLQDSKLLIKLKQFLFLSKAEGLSNYLVGLSYKLPIIVITVMILTYMFWKAFDDLKQNKPSQSLAVITSGLFALVLNFFIQFGVRADEDYLGEYIFAGATLFQIIVFTLFFLSVYILLNHYWSGTIIIFLISTFFTVANFLKFNLRNEPLLLTDLSMVTQLDLIVSYLDIKVILFAVFLVSFLVFIYLFLNKRFLKGKLFSSIWERTIIGVVTFSSILSIFFVFKHQEGGIIKNNIPVLSRLNNSRNVAFTGHAGSARYQSLMYVWIKQLTTPIMEKPTNYSKSKIEDIVDKYQRRAEIINKARKNDISDETVIFILSEALSNPTRVNGVTLTKDILPNIDFIKSQTTSGLMKSDAYGGGTANIETQTLVGLPFYNLSPSISIYNVEVIPKMKTIPSISDKFSFSNKYVIHLGGTQLYSRADVYNRLKFGTFVAAEGSESKPTINEKYGGFPSDNSTYQNVLEKLDTTQSQFFSVITYQNHIPWTMDRPADISGRGEGFTQLENDRLTNYARLVYKTDIETKKFLDKLSKIDKKITVVFYGDHLPGMYPSSAFINDPDSQYLTDYFIWSNKDNRKLDMPLINSSDFPAALLSHTNSKVSPYYALLTDVLDNASVDKHQLNNDQKKIANDLRLVEYDLTSGENYLKDYPIFFEVNK
ncbi:membrane protein [Streptococcus acidominimus]|uniref:Membrane protein n=1 Tax=Streptococcus acidominimus TaxID=1326 RepID=A0A239WXD1_STRAI|nr:alkaline phosphatase family protein [Streptococcus acidominimus]SNV38816.1 membrane protein [Streptococcus acidominimus]